MTQKYTCPSCQEEHEIEVEPEEISAGVALVECPHSNGRHEIEIENPNLTANDFALESDSVNEALQQARQFNRLISIRLSSGKTVGGRIRHIADSVSIETRFYDSTEISIIRLDAIESVTVDFPDAEAGVA